MSHLQPDRWYQEPSRGIPVIENTDVLVCGGGPAGVAAAVAAARQGARVTLIEGQGCLGGIWTTGLLSYIIDADGSHPFVVELIRRVTEHDGVAPQYDAEAPPERPDSRAGILYSAESMKLVLEELCSEVGVRIRLYTRVVAATRNEANRLALVLTESKSGREAWAASVFIDCTGDGDLAAQAGCGFDLGRSSSHETQPMTLMGLVTGPAMPDVARFVTGGTGSHHQGKNALLAEFRRAGAEPSYLKPTLFHIRGDLFALMANHQYGSSVLDADQLTQATIEARREVFALVRALRSLGGLWARIELVATGGHIGVREGRRIRGHYMVSREDVVQGTTHPDAVCRVMFPVDVHATNARTGKGYGNEGVEVRPYEIPLRALIARDVEGLLMAGRCISGDFFAHASYRVTGYAIEMGDASGRTAAWCSRHNMLPSEARWSEIKRNSGPASPAVR